MLIRACLCKGTSAWNHSDCLAEWVKSQGSIECGFCKNDFAHDPMVMTGMDRVKIFGSTVYDVLTDQTGFSLMLSIGCSIASYHVTGWEKSMALGIAKWLDWKWVKWVVNTSIQWKMLGCPLSESILRVFTNAGTQYVLRKDIMETLGLTNEDLGAPETEAPLLEELRENSVVRCSGLSLGFILCGF